MSEKTDGPVLHVLGGGRTARAVARVLHQSGAVRLGQVQNRTVNSAGQAVAFMGAGRAVERLDETIAGDWLLVGLPDGEIEPAIGTLADRLAGMPALAFHLSGSVPARALGELKVPVAAVHPLRAFSDPSQAVEHFPGTWCVAEGEETVLTSLEPAFKRAGARWVTFDPASKAAWHAATVAASNFLVVVNGLASELARGAGMEEAMARRLLVDLQATTLESLAVLGAEQALTGPIERADPVACRRLHEAAHDVLEPDSTALFDALARATLGLARRKRGERTADGDIRTRFQATTSQSD